MKKERALHNKMIFSLVSIIAVTSLLVVASFSTFAWFTINDKAQVNGMHLMVENKEFMSFGSTITAKRTNLTGSVLTNVFNNKNGVLTIKSSTLQENPESDPIDNIENESGKFLFAEMLPGEYVDITIPYVVNDPGETGVKYSISLVGFAGSGEFVIPYGGVDYTHYVLGVFKYRPISMKISYVNGDPDYLYEFPTSDYPYTWLSSYQIDKDDVLPSEIYILRNHEYSTYLNTYSKCEFTFRIYEDFKQYYNLVNDSGTYVSNLLSKQTFNIGDLFFSIDG